MKKLISAAVCLTALMISALLLNCSDESSPTGPGRVHVMMPLAVGSVWNYADTVAGPTSLVFNSSLTVTGDTIVTYEDLDYSVFEVYHFDSYNNIPSTYFMRNDEFGLWEFATACDLDTMYYKQMLAKYPAEVGDEWMKGYSYCDPNDYATGFPPGPAECIAVDSLYTTLMGTFECFVYLSVHEMPIIGTMNIYTFYAVDVGMVAREIQSDMIYWKSSLIDYDLE